MKGPLGCRAVKGTNDGSTNARRFLDVLIILNENGIRLVVSTAEGDNPHPYNNNAPVQRCGCVSSANVEGIWDCGWQYNTDWGKIKDWRAVRLERSNVHLDEEGPVAYCDVVSVDQFPPAPRLDLPVDAHRAALDQLFSLPAGIDQALPFEELVKLDELA